MTQGSTPAAGQAPKNKMDAVRMAVAKLGRHATPTVIREWVKSQFGLDLSNDLISTYKGDIARQERGKQKGPAKKATKATTSGAAPTRPMVAKSAEAVTLTDMALVKELLARVGADNLKR